jgi:integrase
MCRVRARSAHSPSQQRTSTSSGAPATVLHATADAAEAGQRAYDQLVPFGLLLRLAQTRLRTSPEYVAGVLEAWLDETSAADDGIVLPSIRGGRLTDAVDRLLRKHLATAIEVCASLKKKHITFHCLRHTTAMDLLHTRVEQSIIVLWPGHESIETTPNLSRRGSGAEGEDPRQDDPFDSKPGSSVLTTGR